MKKILFLVLVLFIVSCSGVDESLMYFDSKSVAEFGTEDYEKYDLNSKIKPKYLNDLIYIHESVDVNACGDYEGNVEIKNDSIILIYKSSSFFACTSTSIHDVTYIIKNPEQKKYKFKFRYQ